MAESGNGGTTSSQPPEKKEFSMELRLLLAFLLMGVVMFLTPYFYKSVAPPAGAKKTTGVPRAAASTPAPAEAAPAPPDASAPVSAQAEESFAIDTDLYRITFGNR